MGECCGNSCQRGGCDFDLDMIIWVLIIIAVSYTHLDVYKRQI